jgi:hypothetical protein
MPETEIKPDRLEQGSGSGLNADQLDATEGTDYATDTELNNHSSDTNNPHNVNASQAGAIANLGSFPEALAGTLANRPSPGSGQVGRVYVTTDTDQIFRDDGSSWNELGREPQPTTISSNTTTSGQQRLLVDTSSNPITVTLSSANTQSGNTITIKDKSGNASTNNITIDTEGSETIDGASSLTLSSDFGSVTVFSDNSNWFVESRV